LSERIQGQFFEPTWLTSGPGAAAIVILVYVWQNFGFSFLLFIEGLSSIPRDVYEASSIDGVTGWKQFRNITLPLVSPTMLVASVMAIIGALQIFDQPYLLNRGGPGDATRTAVMVIYESALQQLQFGRAPAIGIILMLIIMAVTALRIRLIRRFVHDDGAGPLRAFWSVHAPLDLPDLAMVGILAFNFHWNEFFSPLIMTISQQNFTLPLGLVSLQGNLGSGSVATVLAGVVISMIPALIVATVGQRPLREGLTAGVSK
jgi:ABC-type sugar transport system permease subunit